MPSAGSTVPSTRPVGTCTTKISSEVNVSTFTRMLNARPKKALRSPRVHHGTRKVGVVTDAGRSAVLVMGRSSRTGRSGRDGRGARQRGQKAGRVGDPAEDAAL